MDMSMSEIETALIVAMKDVMTLSEADTDEEVVNAVEDYGNPTESLQVFLHRFENGADNYPRKVQEDCLVETQTYEGSAVLGDQDQWALAPVYTMLVLSENDIVANTWIEFVIVNKGRAKHHVWLRTDYLYRCDDFPLELELVDKEYDYVVRATVVHCHGNYSFKNFGIQTIK